MEPVGYGPWDRTEWDTNKAIRHSTHTHQLNKHEAPEVRNPSQESLVTGFLKLRQNSAAVSPE